MIVEATSTLPVHMPATPGYREATAVFDTLAPVQPIRRDRGVGQPGGRLDRVGTLRRSRRGGISTGHASAMADPMRGRCSCERFPAAPSRSTRTHGVRASRLAPRLGCCYEAGVQAPAPLPMPEESRSTKWLGGHSPPPLPVPGCQAACLPWRVHVAEAEPPVGSAPTRGATAAGWHQGSWQRVHAAIQFVRTAQQQECPDTTSTSMSSISQERRGDHRRELDALSALTDPADGIQIDDSDKNTSYINGQHKAQPCSVRPGAPSPSGGATSRTSGGTAHGLTMLWTSSPPRRRR